VEATGVALTVGTGVAAANGNGRGCSGGVGYLIPTTGDKFDVDGDPPAFTIGEERRFTMVRSSDCNGNGREKEFQGYLISEVDGNAVDTIHLNSERHVPEDSDPHVFHNVLSERRNS
jgi:hypothetical protein